MEKESEGIGPRTSSSALEFARPELGVGSIGAVRYRTFTFQDANLSASRTKYISEIRKPVFTLFEDERWTLRYILDKSQLTGNVPMTVDVLTLEGGFMFTVAQQVFALGCHVLERNFEGRWAPPITFDFVGTLRIKLSSGQVNLC